MDEDSHAPRGPKEEADRQGCCRMQFVELEGVMNGCVPSCQQGLQFSLKGYVCGLG